MYKQLGKIDLFIDFSRYVYKNVAPEPRNSLKLLLILNTSYLLHFLATFMEFTYLISFLALVTKHVWTWLVSMS